MPRYSRPFKEAGVGRESNYYKIEQDAGEEEQNYDIRRGYDQDNSGPRRRYPVNDDPKEDDIDYYPRPEPARHNTTLRSDYYGHTEPILRRQPEPTRQNARLRSEYYRHTEPISLRQPRHSYPTVPINPFAPQNRWARSPKVEYESRNNYSYEDHEALQTGYTVAANNPWDYDVPEGIQIRDSEEDEEDDANDISEALLDIGSEPFTADSDISGSRQRARLEAKVTGSGSGTSQSVFISKQEPNFRPTGQMALYNVVASGYQRLNDIGDSVGNLAHIEYLGSLESPPRRESRDGSNFRWLHLNQQLMDFDTFSRVAQEMPGLPEDALLTLPHFLNRIRKDFETSIRSQHGVMGNFMKPAFVSKRSQSTTSENTLNSGFIFCTIPYHQLSPYSSLEKPPNPRLHPTRTLLQSKYPSTTMQRDQQQVVSNISGTPTGHCFHVPVLWCLIIDDKFAVTCAHGMSAEGITGDGVTLTQSVPQAPDTSASLKTLHIILESRLYVVPIEQCDTWFKLTQNFSQYTSIFDDQMLVHWKGTRISSDLWSVVIQQAQKQLASVKIFQRKRAIKHQLVEDSKNDDIYNAPTGPYRWRDDRDMASETGRFRDVESEKKVDRGKDKTGPAGTSGGDPKPSVDQLQGSGDKDGGISQSPTPEVSSQTDSLAVRDFQVLVWIAIHRGKAKEVGNSITGKDNVGPSTTTTTAKIQSNREMVQTYLNSIHQWLLKQKDLKSKTAYLYAPLKSLDDVERALQSMIESRIESSNIESAKSRLVEAVKSVFTLFVSLDQTGPMCAKIWGAVHGAITAPAPSATSWQFLDFVKTFTQIANLAKTIDSQLSDGKAPSPKELPMPPDALRAWHQFIMSLVSLNARGGPAQADNHAKRCLSLLRRMHLDILKNPKAKKLEELEAVRPTSLLVFIVDRVLSDFTGTQPDLVDTYWEFFDLMESQVEKDPLSRRNQAKITASIAEIKIVLDTLNQQNVIVRQFESELFKSELPYIRGRKHIQGPDPAVINLQKAITTLQGKIASMEELLDSSRYLLERNMNAIRDNKDRQEAAIYAFTIVTIIFLPISTVASVFGMNTNDIRNMAQNQWLFWAAALPLTTIVIVVSLIAAGIIPWTFVRKDRAALATAQAEVSEVKMVRPFISTRNTGGVRNRYPSRYVDDSMGW